ncbi:MAG: hypothetical protein IT365_20105 [Candidatus Hydrogenedentes bacterium]|nr:hypothetical protein [Candidatus Hydrogenedentota bacterium]
MELAVDGQAWAVLKPIGHSGNSRAVRDTTAETLFDQDRKDNRYGEFMKHLGSAMMAGLAAETPPNSSKPYEWKHLLSWLTRDQEARFQSLYDWRSSRSGADTPRFDKPKEHALYLIRLILDLLHEQELEASQTLAGAERELNQLETRIADLRHEPEYRFNEQERALKEALGLAQIEVLNADEGDLASPVFVRRSELERAIFDLQETIDGIERRIAQKRIWLASYDEDRKRFRSALETTEEATETGETEPADDAIRKLRELRGKDCQWGNLPVLECSYVQARLTEADKIIDLEKRREERRVSSETERRLQILEQTQKNHDKIVALLNDLRQKLLADMTEKREKETELAGYRDSLQRLDYHLNQRRQALNLVEGRTPNTELQQETTRAEQLRDNIEQQQTALEELQKSYRQRLDAIGKVYDGLIKRCLSETYSGALHMPKGELQFRIEEATGLSGEAVETLALILADVAAMMCACQGIGHHPRFLVHDSPREADLDRHIYNRYLRAMWALTQESGGKDAAPIQYIVTTTSRPPDDIHDAICLKLEAHPPENMLFRRLLKNVETTTTSALFDPETEEPETPNA